VVRGDTWLCWALFEAAMAHVKCDTAIGHAYRIAEHMGRKVALVAAARRLAFCCYLVLKNRRPYRAFPSWSGFA